MNLNKELKNMETRDKAKQQLNELMKAHTEVNKMISEFRDDAKQCLLENDQAGFELIGNSIFYFQDIAKVIQTIRIQFQTYIKTSEVMGTIEGIRPILKNTAKMMSQFPSFTKNNKDFMKFKKGLLKGQLNMKAMTSMMTSINPAVSQSRSKEEFAALRESILVNEGSTIQTPITNTNTNTAKEEVSLGNEDFFAAINDN